MANLPKILTTIPEVIQWRRSITGTVGFVPTMGALHEGHAALLRKARPKCDISALSIFVNPTQFGPNEDLSKYPRTFEKDLQIAAKEGVDVVFAPTPEVIYPTGYTTFVEETSLSLPLCGKFRPGHYRGVTTIVLKLFNLIKPHFALFGLKDAQQFFVLDKMARDLNLDMTLEGIRTIRESDGLALSSRNIYLSQEERAIAPILQQVLKTTRQRIENLSESDRHLGIQKILQSSISKLEEKSFRVQYVECLSLPNLAPVETADLNADAPYLIAAAAYLGKTRLIDNLILRPEKLLKLGIQVELD